MSKTVWSTAAAVLSVAGLHACATPEAKYPIQPDPLGVAAAPEPVVEAAPSLSLPTEAAPEAETPRAAPLGAVETAALPELAPSAASAQPAPAQPPAQPLAQPLAQAAPGADATLTHVVGTGDTFYAIARRYGVAPQAVAEVNGLSFADTLKLGQRVQLPVGARDRGPEAARAPLASPAPSTAALNVSLQPPARSTLVEPEPPVTAPPPSPAGAPAVATSAAPPASTPSPAAPVIAVPPPPLVAAPVAPPVQPPSISPSLTPAPTTPAGSAGLGRGLFVWPLRGALISGFGPKGVGQRSDGLNIAAAEGDSVRAAAGGTVVYAGDQVKGGFGKLVLIEHENRWFTAYAHLSDIAVRMRQTVSQNQELGRAGRTGNVGAPQLYFEVRHAPAPGDRARPVDPAPLLP